MKVLGVLLLCSGLALAAGCGDDDGGLDCDSACSTIKSCCVNMDMSQCKTGCAEQAEFKDATCEDCFNDSDCGNLVPCVIANCGMPASACD